MANTRFQHKRSSVSGVVPTTSDIASGELGINLADRRLFTSNGTAVFELGSNLTNLAVSSNLTIGASGDLVFTNGAGIFANGVIGTSGQVLHSNGVGVYWADDDQGVTSVATGVGLTGGTITTTGTVSVLANNGITANSTGLFVTQGTGAIVNATGVHVNATYIGTLTANNSTNLNGQPASFYTNATNITTGTLPWAQAPSGTVNTSGAFTITGIYTHSANVVMGNTTVNTQHSNATILISNSTSTTTLGLTDLRIGNTTTNVVIANTVSSFGGNVSISNTLSVANIQLGTTVARGRLHSNSDFTPSFGLNWAQTASFTASGNNGGGIALLQTTTGYGMWLENSGQSLVFGGGNTSTNLTRTVVFAANGSVGIGDIASIGGGAQLDVSRDSGGSRFRVTVSSTNTLLTHVLSDGITFTNSIHNAQAHIWQTSSIERVRIDASGNVGIGNTAPDARLTVTGNANVAGNVVIGGTATVSGNLTVASTSELIIANGAGIQANGSFGTSAQVLSSNGTGVYWATVAAGVNTAAQFAWTNTHSFSANVTFGPGGSPTLFADNSNFRVGIGTSTPTNALDIRPVSTQAKHLFDGVEAGIAYYNADGFTGTEYGMFVDTFRYGLLSTNSTSVSIGSTNNVPFTVFTNNAERMRVTAAGNVGIGNTAPDARLAVTGTANVSGNVVIGGSLNAANVTATVFTGSLTGTASNATNLNSQPGSFYTNATNLATGTVPTARLATGTANSSTFLRGDQTWATPAASLPGGELFNINVSNATGYAVTAFNASAYVAPATAGLQYVVHSIQVTNISAANATISGEIQGTTYANTSFALTVPVPRESAVELLKMPKVLQPNGIIRLQANTASALHAYITVESISSSAYFGSGVDITADATFTDLHTATGNSVITSLLLSNDDGVNDVKARVVWTDGSNVIQGYLCFDMIIPADATVELLEKVKFLPNGHKIRVYANAGNRLEAIIAGRTL